MIAAMLLLATADPPNGDHMIPAFFTGERLLEVCATPANGHCSMYVAGVIDGVFHAQADLSERTLCGGSALTNREAAKLVVQFLREQPELRSKAAAVTVDLALRAHLACPSESSGED
jgi:hypothetical protein